MILHFFAPESGITHGLDGGVLDLESKGTARHRLSIEVQRQCMQSFSVCSIGHSITVGLPIHAVDRDHAARMALIIDEAMQIGHHNVVLCSKLAAVGEEQWRDGDSRGGVFNGCRI